jgi:hypothetical protein
MKPDQVDVLAAAGFGHLHQCGHALETTFTCGLIQTRTLHLIRPRLMPSRSGFANSIKT